MSAALDIAPECFAPVLLSRSALRPSAPLIAANDNVAPSSALPPRRSAAFDSQDQMRTLRAYQNIDGEETFTFYSQSGAILLRTQIDSAARHDASINLLKDIYTDYIRANGKTIARVQRREGESEEEVTYMHQNHLGSPLATTDADGQQLWRESYTPFGEKWQSDGDNDDNVSFTGHIHDTKSNLTYMQARFYDPTIGRFLANDPVGFLDRGILPQQFNRYAYTWNDPINATDPDGEFLDTIVDIAFVAADVVNIVQNGFTAENTASLAGNLAGVVIPGATGLGVAAKGAVTAAKAADKAGGAAKVAKTCCFVAGTLVETEDGLRPIEDVEIGDLVLARNPETGETALKSVTDLIRLNQRQIWEVSLSGNNGASEFFETTDDHPWWIVDEIGVGSWKDTAELSAGMIVTTVDNQTMVITKVLETNRIDATYNLTVADFETYFVGENKVLVHNCPISMDNALDQADNFLDLGTDIKSHTNKNGVQFIQQGADANGQVTKRVGFDVNPSSNHVQKEGPHLNLQTQRNGNIVKNGPEADPHIPIDPSTVRPGDF